MNSGLKIIFMGTPEFAVAALDRLVKTGFAVLTVVTAADKPSGRGLEIHQSAVKKYAMEHGLRILQPTNLKDPQFLSQLNELQADLQVVVAFRMLPEAVWNNPPLGTINLHASLLPQYRGAAPINWAVINGEKESGVTTFLLQHEIDTGKIIGRKAVSISETETAGELHDKLQEEGAVLLLETVQSIEKKSFTQTSQSAFVRPGETLKTAPKLFREDCRIDWSKTTAELYNRIRGLSPYPAAYTEYSSPDGKKIQFKIFKADKETAVVNVPAGEISTDSKTYLKIAASDGFILVHELQASGKKRMNTMEFLRGYPNLKVLKNEQS
jgi:methionyl-tRNA formyltransferase